MKKTLLTFIIGLVALVFFESFDLKILAKQQDGSNPGFTGSPGDSLKNCTACHGGTAITQPNWIKSSIPAEGFEPGVKYTIRAVNTSGNCDVASVRSPPPTLARDIGKRTDPGTRLVLG
jgi:hypothetical protein